MLPCPHCQAKQGYKQKDGNAWRFYCPSCLFSCWLKHYKSYFNK